MSTTTDKENNAIRRALLVFVTTPETRAFLYGQDPRALMQAQAALQGSPELESFFAREREKAAERAPTFCPFCGKSDLRVDIVDDGWPSHSAEDPGNKAVLLEHQCVGCDGRSFWT